MNKRTFPIVLTALALVSALPFAARGQAGFVVGNQTGLELDNPPPPKPAEKKASSAAPAAAAAEKKTTEITCSGETVFDVKAGKAMFIKEVKIADPQFNLVADKLTVYLKKTAKAEPPSGDARPGAPAAPEPSPAENPAAPLSGTGGPSGLERAVAEGNVVISQDKIDEKTGEITHYIGKGQKADYNALSGEMTLSGWPQIQQGLNNQVATEEGTVMIMNKDGHLRTVGRSKTVIQADSKPAKHEAAKP